MKIYVASSWKTVLQPAVVSVCRSAGHEVYDFRNPSAGKTGFAWQQIDSNWERWTPDEHRKALQHPIAQEGFRRDMDALKACDLCILVLPCGRSANLELGYAVGAGKKTVVLEFDPTVPDLMYLMCDHLLTSWDEFLDYLNIKN